MNSTFKFATVLAITLILSIGAFAQSKDKAKTNEAESKTCCQGKGDKATCCQSEACNLESTATAATSSDGLSTTIACGCCTQGGASATAPIILALDIDKDGIVSAAEIKNATQSLIALDNNRDGKLDRAEMHGNSGFSKVNASTKIAVKAKPKAKVSRMMSGATANYFAQKMLEADANGNNILEGGEINANTQRIMHIIDLNEDGQLSLSELKKMQESINNYDPSNGGDG